MGANIFEQLRKNRQLDLERKSLENQVLANIGNPIVLIVKSIYPIGKYEDTVEYSQISGKIDSPYDSITRGIDLIEGESLSRQFSIDKRRKVWDKYIRDEIPFVNADIFSQHNYIREELRNSEPKIQLIGNLVLPKCLIEKYVANRSYSDGMFYQAQSGNMLRSRDFIDKVTDYNLYIGVALSDIKDPIGKDVEDLTIFDLF